MKGPECPPGTTCVETVCGQPPDAPAKLKEASEQARQQLQKPRGYISNETGLSFRQTPNRESFKMGSLTKGTVFSVNQSANPWAHITVETGPFKGREGWIHAEQYTEPLEELTFRIPESLEAQLAETPKDYEEFLHIMIQQQKKPESKELMKEARITAKREDLADQNDMLAKMNLTRVYEDPKFGKRIRIRLKKGTKLRVLKESEDGRGRKWYQVETSNGTIGWLPEKRLKPNPVKEKHSKLMELAESLKEVGWDGSYPVAVVAHRVTSREARALGIKRQHFYLLDADGLTEFTVTTGQKGLGNRYEQTPEGRILVKGTEFQFVTEFGTIMGPKEYRKEYKQKGIEQIPSLSRGLNALMTTMKFGMYGLDEHNQSTLARGVNIHGTNRESSLGGRYSDGCIRMSNLDAAYLAFSLNGKRLYLNVVDKV